MSSLIPVSPLKISPSDQAARVLEALSESYYGANGFTPAAGARRDIILDPATRRPIGSFVDPTIAQVESLMKLIYQHRKARVAS